MQACLGLRIDALAGEIAFHAPRLPLFLNWIELRGLRVGACSVDLRLHRYPHGVGVEVTQNDGGVAIRIEV